MPTVKKQPVANQRTASALLIWQKIRTQLERAQQRIIGEIGSYPAPRPACDTDFNHLLEERAQISDELNRLDAAANSTSGNSRRQIEEFISTSRCLDAVNKQKIRFLIW